MGAYLDRLNEQFDEITAGIDEILNRAADEGREVTDEENTQVERDQNRAEELKKAIDHYAGIEQTRAAVEVVRGKIPASPAPRRQNAQVVEREVKLEDLFPTVGHYVETVHRATQNHDKEALELLERAETAHQTLADNPGIVPRPILGPLITLIDGIRPFITGIGVRPLVAGSFDRPNVTQHVAIGKQAVEKDRTASQQMKIGKLPVSAETFAGHLNISRQDIKWTSPGILQLVVEDFAAIYALESNAAAVGHFETSLEGDNVPPALEVPLDHEKIRAAVLSATASVLAQRQPLGVPDAVFLSADVWAALASLLTPMGTAAFPGLDLGAGESTLLGRAAIVEPFLEPNTFVVGRRSLLEWYENRDGLISVAEPDVLGQLVGYAGYGAFLNTHPELFYRIELPPEQVEEAAAAVTAPTE